MIAIQSWFCVLTAASIAISGFCEGINEGHAKLEVNHDETHGRLLRREKRQTTSNANFPTSVEHLPNKADHTGRALQDRGNLGMENATINGFLRKANVTENAAQQDKSSDHENKPRTPLINSTRRSFIKLGLLTQPKPNGRLHRNWKPYARDTTTAVIPNPNHTSRMRTPTMKPLSLHAALLGLGSVMAVVVLVGILRHYGNQRGQSKHLREVCSGAKKERKKKRSRRSKSRDRKSSTDRNWVWSMSTIHELEDEDLVDQTSTGLTASVADPQSVSGQLPTSTVQDSGEETSQKNVLGEQRNFTNIDRVNPLLEHQNFNQTLERSLEGASVDGNISDMDAVGDQTQVALSGGLSSPSLTCSSVSEHSAVYHRLPTHYGSLECPQTQDGSAADDDIPRPETFHSFRDGFCSDKASLLRSENGLCLRAAEYPEENLNDNAEWIYSHGAIASQMSVSETLPSQTSYLTPFISNIRLESNNEIQDNSNDGVDPSHSQHSVPSLLSEREPCPSLTERRDAYHRSQTVEYDGRSEHPSLQNTLPNSFYKPSSHGRHRRHRERRRMRDHISRTRANQMTTHQQHSHEPVLHLNSYCSGDIIPNPCSSQTVSNVIRSRSLSPGVTDAIIDIPEYPNLPMVLAERGASARLAEADGLAQPPSLSQQNSVVSTPPNGDVLSGQVLVQQLSNGAQLIYIPAPPLPQYGEESPPPPYQQ